MTDSYDNLFADQDAQQILNYVGYGIEPIRAVEMYVNRTEHDVSVVQTAVDRALQEVETQEVEQEKI